MNLRLRILKAYLPAPVKKKALAELFVLTAQAFACDPPEIKSQSHPELLKSYALFTKEQVEKLIDRSGDVEPIKARLFQNAQDLGEKLRKELRLRRPEDVLAMSRLLYKILGIDFHATTGGEVTIHSCFFSRFYTAPVCRIISALDEGVAAGLSAGGKLDFAERITEGKDCCRARFIFKEY